MKYPLYIISAAAALFSLTACSDVLDKHSSAYDSDGYYRSDAGLDEGVTAIYRIVPFAQNWDVPPTMVQDIYTANGLQETENRTIGAGGGLTRDLSILTGPDTGALLPELMQCLKAQKAMTKKCRPTTAVVKPKQKCSALMLTTTW